jgi:hypothetical protein
MIHRASRNFWRCYRQLPTHVQRLANKNFQFLKANPSHASLHFKRLGPYWSARVGAHYRALAIESGTDLVWFWIGTHSEYNQTIKR